MSMISAEERSAILDTFQRLLADLHSEHQMRQAIESDEGFDRGLWEQMGELGIAALLVDPEYGGIGAGAIELELLMEEAGASLLCSPFVASSVIAASYLNLSDDEEVKQRLLPEIAAGNRIATVAMTGDAGLWTDKDVTVEACTRDENAFLNGVANYVIHGQNADILLVLALKEGKLALFEVEPDSDGLQIESLPVNDPTLRIARMVFENVEAKQISGIGSVESASAMNVARIALAGENAGAARKIFEITVDYIANRYQFGRPVGGFQALKHMAADLLIEVENATSVARESAQAHDSNAAQVPSSIALASFASAEAFFTVAAQCIQMSGGIAFTMEYVAHLYWRRARSNLRLFGSSDFYREQYLAALEKSA